LERDDLKKWKERGRKIEKNGYCVCDCQDLSKIELVESGI